jgi:hypothetical protein
MSDNWAFVTHNHPFLAEERRATRRYAVRVKETIPMKKLAQLTALLALALPQLAARPSAAADALPKPVADMECMVGQWKGGGTIAMGKDTAKINASWSCKRTSARYGVLCSFHVTGIPGVPVYDETDLMGYEPNSNTYHWYSVTNSGETHDHVAQPPTGNAIQFVFTGTQEGKPLREVIDLDFAQDSKQVTGRAETFVEGASVSLMQIELKK